MSESIKFKKYLSYRAQVTDSSLKKVIMNFDIVTFLKSKNIENIL